MGVYFLFLIVRTLMINFPIQPFMCIVTSDGLDGVTLQKKTSVGGQWAMKSLTRLY